MSLNVAQSMHLILATKMQRRHYSIISISPTVPISIDFYSVYRHSNINTHRDIENKKVMNKIYYRNKR